MSAKALLISEDQLLNTLYATNLYIYVDLEVTSLLAPHELLESKESIDFDQFQMAIIIIGQKDKGQSVIIEKIKEHKTLPLIIAGDQAQSDEMLTYIKNQYAIKDIIRASASMLGITAKDMANKNVPEYFPIPGYLINKLSESNVEIYQQQVAGSFQCIYDPVASEWPDKIEQESFLYIKATHRLKFINHITEKIINALNALDLDIDDRFKVLNQSYQFLSEQIYDQEQTPKELQKISEACVNSFKTAIKEVPNIEKLLQLLMSSQGEYIYNHSVLGAYIASKIIENMEWGTKEQIEKVNFVMFYHDIFLVPIFKKYPDFQNEEELVFSSEISEKEKDIVLEHAKMAGELVRGFSRLPIGADMIITQHHGMSSGVGFAANFKDDISPLSKVVAISEEVADIFFKLSKTNKKLSDYLPDIHSKIKNKFKAHTYQKLIKALEQAKF